MTLALTRFGRIVVLLVGATILLALPLSVASPASAHPLSTSAVLLDVGSRDVTATVELPLDELSIARNQELTASTVVRASTLTALRSYVREHLSATDAEHRTWTTEVTGGQVRKVGGIDNLVLRATLRPDSGTVGDFVLDDDVIMDQLVSHRIFVSARYGDSGEYTTLAMLSWQTRSVPVASTTPPESQGFVAAIRVGVHHISSGSDHLLFLIMLLLPAPLLARKNRWTRRDNPSRSARRVVHVVTAFAIGHSITLALGALGWVHLPTRLVESGIALSVLVSAIHAVRPLLRRGEVLIASGFGLLHGLAFASLLGSLDLSRGSLVTTLLGFNLGIEVAQLLVVALVMPSLLLLSQTPVYPAVRLGLAVLGIALATGWLAARSGAIASNPLEPLGDLVVDHPLLLVVLLAVAAALSWVARDDTGRRLVRPSAVRAAGATARQRQPQRAGEQLRSRPGRPLSTPLDPSVWIRP